MNDGVGNRRKNLCGCEKDGSDRLNKTAEARKILLGLLSAHPKSRRSVLIF